MQNERTNKSTNNNSNTHTLKNIYRTPICINWIIYWFEIMKKTRRTPAIERSATMITRSRIAPDTFCIRLKFRRCQTQYLCTQRSVIMYNSITFNWAYEFSSPLCVCAQKKKFIYSLVFNSKIEFHNLQFWMDCKWCKECTSLMYSIPCVCLLFHVHEIGWFVLLLSESCVLVHLLVWMLVWVVQLYLEHEFLSNKSNTKD